MEISINVILKLTKFNLIFNLQKKTLPSNCKSDQKKEEWVEMAVLSLIHI